jgi:hypothetical protein
MSEVRCLEDLRKKETPYYKKIKPSRSYVALDEEQECYMPGPNSRGIAKKPSGSSCANLAARNNSKNMYRPPPIPPFFLSSFLRDFVDRRIGLSQM